ncbi:Hsp90 cochaperone [Hanseniaspora vineae]
MSVEEYKSQGNEAFKAKDYSKAVEFFTKAIEASDEPNHVLLSNRSACNVLLKNYPDSLQDAQECVKLQPSWAKGYSRVAAAQQGLGNLDEAEASYKKSKNGLKQVKDQQEQRQSMPDLGIGKMFQDPNLIEKLKKNPKVAHLMNDPALVQKLLQIQANPRAMGPEVIQDPNFMSILAALMGIDLSMDPQESGSTPKDDFVPPKEAETENKASEPVKEETKKESPKPEEKAAPKAEPMEVDDEKTKSLELKDEGNKLYKAKQFDQAIAKYEAAWDLYKDVTYLNNKAAAQYEAGQYEDAIKTLNDAVEQGREYRADYKIIAKSFHRIGNCYVKLNDLQNAIQFYQKSLTEHRTPEVLNKLRKAEKDIKIQAEKDYINPEKAEEARLEGRDFYNKGDWPSAVKSYTEMIKRAPEDPRGYSNRAAVLAKLMSFPDCIKDCDLAIEKDPNFVKAYIRKATAQIAVKEFGAAIKTLDVAQEKDVAKAHAREIQQLYMKASQQRFQPESANETPEQVYARAMKDPEVAQILQDPVMQSILQQAQSNPAALQEHLKNPDIMHKIQTLISAGIISTR